MLCRTRVTTVRWRVGALHRTGETRDFDLHKFRTYHCAMSASAIEPAEGAPVRLEDIADDLGVSVATVSRALSGNPRISAKTKAAVQEAAARLGYRGGASQQRPKEPALGMIGVVVGALHNQFMTLLLTHLHDCLQELGYHITLLIDSLDDTDNLLAFKPLIEGHLDGLIFATATRDSSVVAEMQRLGVPVVLVVRSVENVDVDTVEVDNFQAGVVAAQHLYELGHRRLALIMGPRNTSTSWKRAEGALHWLAERGIPRESVSVVWGDFTTESGYSGCVGLFSKGRFGVTGIIAGNDTIALGVLEALKLRGLSVPAQVSVVGFDDMPLAGSPLIGLTTVRQPVEALAKTAARRLVERMRAQRNVRPTYDVLPVQLVRRDSSSTPPVDSPVGNEQ